MLHTFVVPAYKDSPYLERCINSLLQQKNKSQIVICTSTPSSFIEQIAQKHTLPYFVNTEQKGLAADWNFALSHAATPYVTIAHQDDIYLPNFSKKVVERLEKQNQSPLIVFTDYQELVNEIPRHFSVNGFIKKILLVPFLFKSHIKSRFWKKSVLVFGDTICCPAVTLNMARMPNFSFSGDFDCNPDWHAWLKLSQTKGGFYYLNQALMQHRIHEGSATSARIKSGIREKEEYKIFEMIWGARIARLIMKLYTLSHKENI